MILNYNKIHDLPKLNLELMTLKFLQPFKNSDEEGITPIAFIASNGDDLKIRTETELTTEQIGLVNSVVEAHNPTLLPKLPTTDERLQQAEDTILYLLMNGGM